MKVKKMKSFDELDKERFVKLVESGFKRKIVPHYFDFTHPQYICLALGGEEYAGAIVVEPVPELKGVSYLDKIVVAPNHQGKGLCNFLWEHLNGSSQKVIWRAKKENPIIPFYKKKSDGVLTFPDITDFMFFYYGLNKQELWKALDFAINKKPSLE